MSPIQREIDELKTKISESGKWMKLVPDIDCDYNYISGDMPSIHLQACSYDVLLKTIRAFARRGFRIIERSESYNYVSLYYTLKNKSNDKINLWFPVETSKSCRRIQVGEKIEPIYKIVCE